MRNYKPKAAYKALSFKNKSKTTKNIRKKGGRRKYLTAGTAYAMPTSTMSQGPLETNVQANLSDDPTKAKQSLINQNRSQIEEQKAAKEDREREIQERRDRNKQQMQEQGLQLGDEAAKLAKDKLKPSSVSDLASSLATAPTLLPGASSTAATGISSAGAQSLATQGSGMSAAFGQKVLEQQLKNELTKTAGKELGKTVATEGAKKGIQMGASSSAVNPIALAANLGGTALKTFGGDDDDTTYNTAEVSGGLLQRAGEFGGYGAALGTIIPGLGNVVGGIAGGVIGLGVGAGEMLKNKNKAIKEKDKLDAKEAESELLSGINEKNLFRQAYGTTGRDLGFNVNQQSQNSYLGSNQMFKHGGVYSEGGTPTNPPEGMVWRGVTDAQGKKVYDKIGSPSNVMVKSFARSNPDRTDALPISNKDKVIRTVDEYNTEMATRRGYKKGGMNLPGGKMKPIPGSDAVEFVGNKHGQGGRGSDSGILLDDNTEVEGGETMDKMNYSDGTKGDYFFSDHLKLGGISFAQRHKNIVKKGNSQKQIQELAKLQELTAMKQGADENGQRDPAMIAKEGGRRQFQNAGPDTSPNTVDLSKETFGEFDASTLTGEGMGMANVPEGQSLDMSGTYGGVTADQVQKTMSMNPWFDWEGFNPSDRKDVENFQNAYNERATSGNQIKSDGKFGQQTQSAYIPAQTMPEVVDETVAEEKKDEEVLDVIKEEELGEPSMELPRRKGLGDIAVGAAQFIPAAYALSKKMDPLQSISSQPISKQRLPRVNFNNLRARNSNNLVALNRSTGSGSPSDQVMKLAALRSTQQGDIDVANAEANQNKQLAATEAGMEQQRQMQAARNKIGVDQYNASMKEDRGRYEREEKLGALTSAVQTGAGIYTDYMQRQAMENVAGAVEGETGVLDRFDLTKQAEKDYRRAVRKNDTDSPFYDNETGKFMSRDQVKQLTAKEYQKLLKSQTAGKQRYGGKYQLGGPKMDFSKAPEANFNLNAPEAPDYSAKLNPYIERFNTPEGAKFAIGANPSLQYKNVGVGMNVGKTLGQKGINKPSFRASYTLPIGRTRRNRT